MGNKNSNRERNQKDEINRLPVEILEKVFATLTTLEYIRNCCYTSTKWSQIIANMFNKGIEIINSTIN